MIDRLIEGLEEPNLLFSSKLFIFLEDQRVERKVNLPGWHNHPWILDVKGRIARFLLEPYLMEALPTNAAAQMGMQLCQRGLALGASETGTSGSSIPRSSGGIW